MQLLEILRRQGPEPEAQFRRGRDDIALDAAFHLADVEAQPGQAAEAGMRQGGDVIE